jgi:hypothetical protein
MRKLIKIHIDAALAANFRSFNAILTVHVFKNLSISIENERQKYVQRNL